jgi:hypothetical protein
MPNPVRRSFRPLNLAIDMRFVSVTCQKYAHAVHSFLTTGINEGAQTNFASRRLVGIGHSLGANAMCVLRLVIPTYLTDRRLLAQEYEPQIPFISLVIVEPMVSPEGSGHVAKLRQKLIETAYLRHDVWRSKDEARTHLLETKRCRNWDVRVVDLFVVSHRMLGVRSSC